MRRWLGSVRSSAPLPPLLARGRRLVDIPPPRRRPKAGSKKRLAARGQTGRTAPWLLVAERFDRVHERGPPRWVEAKEDADGDRDAERQDDRAGGHEGFLIGNERNDDLRDGYAQRHPEDAADPRKHDRLDQELLGDVFTLGAKRPA